MKKLTIIMAIIILILCLNKEEKLIMPKEVIRFRVIANSNEEKDQQIKKAVVKGLNNNIKKLEFIPKDIDSSRKMIKESLPTFKEQVEKTLKELDAEEKYTINYGMNYFPEKEYKGIVYKEGEYESVVVTLGNGLGENFWCILFPPLCLLDGKEEDKTDVEYTSFIKEIIEKYF